MDYLESFYGHMDFSKEVQTDSGSDMKGKKPTKCKWCGEEFPKRGGKNVVKCRMEHLRLFHRMEEITLANYEEHFE